MKRAILFCADIVGLQCTLMAGWMRNIGNLKTLANRFEREGYTMICPKCGKENTDDWPVDVSGTVKWGACQSCWESESDDAWWYALELLMGCEK